MPLYSDLKERLEGEEYLIQDLMDSVAELKDMTEPKEKDAEDVPVPTAGIEIHVSETT